MTRFDQSSILSYSWYSGLLGSAGAYRSCHPEEVASSSKDHAPFKGPSSPHMYVLDSGKKPEYPEKTHTDT